MKELKIETINNETKTVFFDRYTPEMNHSIGVVANFRAFSMPKETPKFEKLSIETKKFLKNFLKKYHGATWRNGDNGFRSATAEELNAAMEDSIENGGGSYTPNKTNANNFGNVTVHCFKDYLMIEGNLYEIEKFTRAIGYVGYKYSISYTGFFVLVFARR